jgi:hypothetical protein
MSGPLRIVAAHFDPRMWWLELTTSTGETDTWDLTKYDGFGMDTGALLSVRICECGTSVWFPDFPPPGAIMTFED